MNLRKTFFILPNLFTLSSVFCGFFAITLCAGAPSIDSLYSAAVAICFAYFFDLADGRVARLTKTQSDLGLQLDSLADVISFGVAPALLVYKWGLTHFGRWGIFIAFLFCAAGALRLARFNVLAMQKDASKPGKFIIGLPVPAASAVLISLVLLNHQLSGSFVDVGQPALAALVVILSYLMVSRIRFRSFKDLRLSRRTITGFLAIAAFTVSVLVGRMHSAFIFVVLMAAYLGLGLTEEVFFYRRRREEDRAAKATGPVVLEAEGGARSDEEVLAELGAYDQEEEPADSTPPQTLEPRPLLMHANIISHDEARIAELIKSTRRVAVLGIKTEAQRGQPGFYVAEALHDAGIEIVPVPVYYPEAQTILGQKVYRSVAAVPGAIDIVDVFRRSGDVAAHIDDILAKRPRAVWLQSGIRDDESAERFAEAGLLVVQDRCLMVDHRRFA